MSALTAEEFGLWLVWRMERAGLTERSFATAIGCSQQRISRYCRGASMPSMEMRLRIFSFFDHSAASGYDEVKDVSGRVTQSVSEK